MAVNKCMDSKRVAAVLALAAALLPGAAFATTREVADLDELELTIRRSVLNQLTHGVFKDPYDELQRRPFNLLWVSNDREGYVSPWPGQQGEHDNYLNALIGNNGANNLRNDSDALSGAYIRQPAGSIAWGVSASFLADDVGASDSVISESFADSQELSGADARFGLAWRLSDQMSLGGGLTVNMTNDEAMDSSFEQGVGGFFSSDSLERTNATLDVGLRRMIGLGSSWQVQAELGTGSAELFDHTDTLDAAGGVSSRFVLTNYETTDRRLRLSGAWNKLYAQDTAELELGAGVEMLERSLDTTNLAYVETGGTVTPTLTLLADDPVQENTVFATAAFVALMGQTQIFAGGELATSQADGSTQVDSLGTIVNESIDDSLVRLGLSMGLRQPLGTDRLRLIASAKADVLDDEVNTRFDSASTGETSTSTTLRYGFGVEGVFSNVTFDVAWLFGQDVALAPGIEGTPQRQAIDFNSVVVSALFGW